MKTAGRRRRGEACVTRSGSGLKECAGNAYVGPTSAGRSVDSSILNESFLKTVFGVFIVMSAAGVVPWLVHCGMAAGSAATLTIKSSIDGGPWNIDSAIYPLTGRKIVLKVDHLSVATTRWYQIIPDISKPFKNANFPWDPNPYQWIGFAKIKYSRKELEACRGKWEIEPFAQPKADEGQGMSEVPKHYVERVRISINSLLGRGGTSEFPKHYRKDVGSFWFQVEIEKAGKVMRSAGIADSDHKGLSPKVFRVSIRDGEGYLGYLTSFFNVPGVFGSVMYQSNNYIGVDCSKVLAAAYGRWKGTLIRKAYNVDALVLRLPKRAESEVVDGKPNRELAWGKDIRRGDLIAVKYAGKKRYQHIGAFFADANEDGLLGPEDLIIHAGPEPLHFTALQEGKFNGHIVVLEPDFSKLPK